MSVLIAILVVGAQSSSSELSSKSLLMSMGDVPSNILVVWLILSGTLVDAVYILSDVFGDWFGGSAGVVWSMNSKLSELGGVGTVDLCDVLGIARMSSMLLGD